MKTRYYVLLLCMLSTVQLVNAQIRWGVEAGMNLSHYLDTGEYIAKEIGGMKGGFQAGVTVDYETSKHWVLMSGLSFLQNRSTMAVAYYMTYYFPKTDVKVNNLVLPVKVGYNIRLNDNLNLIPSIGAYASYAFSAGSCDMVILHPTDTGTNPEPVKWKPMSGYEYETEPNWLAAIPKHKRWDIGGTAGIKAVIYKNYTVSFNYSVGISQVFLSKLRNSNMQFSVGYRF